MRSGLWLLATCLVVAFAWAAGAADDLPLGELQYRDQGTKPRLTYFSRSGQTATAEAPAAKPAAGQPQRYSRTPAKKPAAAAPAAGPKPLVKNYYDELFEEVDRETARRAAEESASDESAGSFRDLLQADHEQEAEEKAPITQASGRMPAPAPAARPAAASKPAPRSGVINAGYKNAGASGARIQQLKATGGKSLAIPAPAKSTAPKGIDATPSAPKAEAATMGPQTPQVAVKWVARGDVNIGQECKCALLIQNTGKVVAQRVVVEAHFPKSVRLITAEPYPAESQEHLEWTFDTLAPGEEKTIEVTMIPTKKGELATSANVRFTGTAAALFQVEEPQLKVALKGPAEVMIGDPASQLVTVSNPGSGVAHDVVLEALVPNGLEHTGGKRLVMGIGSISPGESRSVRLALAAVTGGEQILIVEAKTAAANLTQTAEARINVLAPSLELAVEGPGLRYIDRHAKYTIRVANNSTVATNNVRVTEVIPAGFSFLKANKGGKPDATSKTLSWFVGRLESGQSAELEVELMAKEMGQHVHQIRAVADNGVEASTSTETRVEGTASLVMEVSDLDDPVEVASETAYEIRVRNEGSKAAQNLSVSCELPAGVEMINCKGPTECVSENGMLIFKPIGGLAPKESATYRVHVRGMEAGNLRFRARLMSESSEKPVIVEETTQFYAD